MLNCFRHCLCITDREGPEGPNSNRGPGSQKLKIGSNAVARHLVQYIPYLFHQSINPVIQEIGSG
jgi:hypothetical protein